MDAVTTETKGAELTEARRRFALRLGDDAMILGQQLGKWVGHAPALELEMMIANFGLDLIGEAQLFFEYAAELEGQGRSADDMAFKRDILDYTNLLLVEQPNGDFAETIARHFFYTVFHDLHFQQLQRSNDERIRQIAAKTLNEIRYHERVARQWMLRLGDGTEESHSRLQNAVDKLWRFTGEMFEVDDLTRRLIDAGIAVDLEGLQPTWQERVDAVLADAGSLTLPEGTRMNSGGRRGHHSDHLGHILAEMQFMQRAYPGLEW